MSLHDTIMAIFTILGGLALFLLGMNIMTGSLREAAGDRLRVMISRSTQNRYRGLSLGTVLGFLIHSSAATVMTVGFVNAGLLGLVQSFPLLFGANIGTTLSMQLVSFRLTDFAYVAVSVGFFVQLLWPRRVGKNVGRVVLGFGILFVGMALMSGAVEPHREAIAPWLERIDGSNWMGMLLGILVAWAFTAIVQSSGATIGIAFALASAGAFTSLEQVYPIVLGAHLGTPTTALLASLGCNLDAKRAAVGNLLFNVFNTLMALLFFRAFVWLVTLTSTDLVHQTANLHTLIMLAAALVLLPFTTALPGLMQWIIPGNGDPEDEKSYLDPELISKPEKALSAALQEVRRSLSVCQRSLCDARSYLQKSEPVLLRRITRNEEIVDEVKKVLRAYLDSLTRRYLSRRQAMLVQHITRIISDVERVGDHIESVAETAHHQSRHAEATFDEQTLRALMRLFDGAQEVLDACVDSMEPEAGRFSVRADQILNARNGYIGESRAEQEAVNERVANHELTAAVGLYFSDYALTLDRMVRHCRFIAREMKQPSFGIEPRKLERFEPPVWEKRYPKKARRERERGDEKS